AMAGARSATDDYSSALARHVDAIELVAAQGTAAQDLMVLTRAMLERTRKVEQELAQSERRAARLQAELDETRRQSEQDHLTG
ncbi:hypothetical protein ABTN14_19835, partial [Acinetobacter baumannii]